MTAWTQDEALEYLDLSEPPTTIAALVEACKIAGYGKPSEIEDLIWVFFTVEPRPSSNYEPVPGRGGTVTDYEEMRGKLRAIKAMQPDDSWSWWWRLRLRISHWCLALAERVDR